MICKTTIKTFFDILKNKKYIDLKYLYITILQSITSTDDFVIDFQNNKD